MNPYHQRFHIMLLCVWSIAVLGACSDAGLSLLAFLFAMGAGLLLGLYWLARLIAYFYRRRKSRGVFPRRSYWNFAQEPMLAALAVCLISTGAARYLRFFVSQPFLERHVSEIQAGHIAINPETGFAAPRLVGLYWLDGRTDILPDGSIRFITSRQGVFDSAGFIKSAQTPPPATRMSEDAYQHLHGAWWVWTASW